MNKKYSLWLLCTLLLLSSCGLRQREQQLAAQQQSLQEQTQQLILREQALALRENQLNRREKELDSVSIAHDSLYLLYPKLPGNWNINMVCSAATCPGSAVGDTKNEQWQFSFAGNSIVVKAFSKQTLTRIYTGTVNDGQLQLSAQNPDASIDTTTQIKVYLRPTGDSTSMEGKRNILRPNCQIVYNMTLKKQ